MEKSIALCGFMGCGKTTVGKELATLLNRPFFDSDLFVEEKQNMKISEIFDKYGEDKFRDLEHQAISELAKLPPCVISLGGGAVMYHRNTQALKDCVTVFIDTPFALIEERLKDDESRPLARDKKAMSQLYIKRYPFYKSASQIVVSADNNPAVTAQIILNSINEV